MPRGLRLIRYDAGDDVNYLHFSAYRIRVEAVDPVNMDPRIFLYRRNPPDPLRGNTVRDVFFTVCSPVDLEEYPPEAPDPAKQYPFFRRSWVELDFRTTQDAEEFWRIVRSETSVLLAALDRLERLRYREEVWLGSAAPDPDASSEVSIP